jgi:hypothetical protein
VRILPIGVVSWLVFTAGLVAAAYLLRLELQPSEPVKPARAVTVCSGCGSKWTAMHDGPMEPITQCPNCPMSDEEFELLKEQARKRIAEANDG